MMKSNTLIKLAGTGLSTVQKFRGRRAIRRDRESAAPSKRPIHALRHLRHEDDPDKVTFELTVDGLSVSDIVINSDGEWVSVGAFQERSALEQTAETGARAFAATLSLSDLGRAIVSAKAAHGDEPASGSDVGLRASLFIRAHTCREVPSSARDAEPMFDGIGFVIPLGRAAETELDRLHAVPFGTSYIQPYINRFGIVTVAIGGRASVGGRPVNEKITLEGGRLLAEGRINVHSVDLDSLDLIVVGRVSGFKLSVPADFQFDAERTRRKFGLRLYRFRAEFDLSTVAGRLPDDTLDLYVEVKGLGLDEVVRRRFGRSRYLVRQGAQAARISDGARTVLLTPYFTFKAKNPSIYSEVFDTPVFEHMVEAVASGSLTRHSRSAGVRPIWVVGELPYKAQDNGMHFFKYLRDRHPEIDAYYVIERDSPERINLAGYDHVISFRSKEHVEIALSADRFVGTHHPDYLFPTRSPRFSQVLADVPKVFLQHGVMGAKWMVPNYGKTASSFETDLIITSSEREKQMFVKDFGYSDSEVAVTGLPRFDALLADDVEVDPKQILIIPTWRPWLQDPETFTESDYFAHWSGLLGSEEVTALTRDHRCQIVFCLHPNMRQFSSHFDLPGVKVVTQGEIDVQLLMKQSGLMITDYSSVAFDFSFLRRPVAYYQFDPQRFAEPHVSPHDELPGPIFAESHEVTSWLAFQISGGAADSDRYLERSRIFLAHNDRNNSERVYQSIMSMKPVRSMFERVKNSEEVHAAGRMLRRNRRYRPIMKQVYRALRMLPLDSNIIVFESGQGRQLGDSPGALYDELVRRGDSRLKVWIYNKRFPIRDDNTITVKRYSPQYFWYLARSKYWVSNQNMPHFIHRRRGGLYIQTWHGTPLKKMFLDIEQIVGRDPGYVGRVTEATRQWNVLVSPNAYTTAIMKSAYGYTGKTLEVGYPRNDGLLNESATARRKETRQQLGLADSDFAVLYAPTFRDDRPTTRGRFAFSWPFDPYEFHNRFRGSGVKLLVRAHVLISNSIVVDEGIAGSVQNVTKYPDIQNLYLASDMLVTDYSSVFFDYSLLRRPMAFYAYDLEEYREDLRGFNLDYESELPGPIVQSASSLFDEIERARSAGVRDSEKLDCFVQRFAPFDDGHAAKRVVNELLSGNEPNH